MSEQRKLQDRADLACRAARAEARLAEVEAEQEKESALAYRFKCERNIAQARLAEVEAENERLRDDNEQLRDDNDKLRHVIFGMTWPWG